MIISTITLPVALAIGNTSGFKNIEMFMNYANPGQYIDFTHRNFYYSYPVFGKQWMSGKDCEFHRVNTKCNVCNHMPERNFAGIGSIYLLHNGIALDQTNRIVLLCQKHIAGYLPWSSIKDFRQLKTKQLELF